MGGIAVGSAAEIVAGTFALTAGVGALRRAGNEEGHAATAEGGPESNEGRQ